VLKQPGFLSRQQIWPGLSKMLNDLNKVLLGRSNPGPTAQILEHFPLPEEFDLQAFLPLSESFKNYNFRQVLKGCTLDPNAIKTLRAMRLLAQGKMIANENWKGRAVLKVDLLNSFEAIEDEENVTSDFFEVLEKELKIHDDPVLESESVTEGDVPESPVSSKVSKKTKNVAMEAILRQAATTSTGGATGSSETKQVTFKTPSPNFSDPESNSRPSSSISQEELRSNLPAYLMKTAKTMPVAENVAPIRMDFSVPPPPLIQRPFLPSTTPPNIQPNIVGIRGGQPNIQKQISRPLEPSSPWTRPVDPAAVAATFRGPSYQLFAGNGPAWSLPPMERPQGSQVPMMQPPPPRIAATSQANQNFLFQPGPSPLEKLLQQNPKPQQ